MERSFREGGERWVDEKRVDKKSLGTKEVKNEGISFGDRLDGIGPGC